MADTPETLGVYCGRCGGAVTIECDTVPPEPPVGSHGQEWFCPHCAASHHGYFPGLIAWVMKGHADVPTV